MFRLLACSKLSKRCRRSPFNQIESDVVIAHMECAAYETAPSMIDIGGVSDTLDHQSDGRQITRGDGFPERHVEMGVLCVDRCRVRGYQPSDLGERSRSDCPDDCSSCLALGKLCGLYRRRHRSGLLCNMGRGADRLNSDESMNCLEYITTGSLREHRRKGGIGR